MRITGIFFTACAMFALSACGGGGSSSNNATSPPPAGVSEQGSLTLLIGDGPLDEVDEVNITITEIILLGDDGQQTIFDGEVGPINLLELQNVTELLFDGEVPAGDYSKIRLRISALEVVDNGVAEAVQLPANGRIDLNPQGSFNISPNEDLVVQIDFDLDRSVHVVQTGNGRYRFRPVVFVDIIDQTDNLRLSHLFGQLTPDQVDSPLSDVDLCELNSTAAEPPCYDVVLSEDVVLLDIEGMVLGTLEGTLDNPAHVYGHYFIGAEGGRFFRARLIVYGAQDSVVQITGDITSDAVDGVFSAETNENDVIQTYNVIATDALVLDELGAAFDAPIVAGQGVDAWAQVTVLDAVTTEGDFPAFLAQISPVEAVEESVQGTLLSVEGDLVTLTNDEGQACIVVTAETVIQQVVDEGDAAEVMDITLTDLSDLVETAPVVEAFGPLINDCIEAELIVVESDSGAG